MFKGILGFVLFIFFVFVFIAILVGERVYRAIKKAKKAAQQVADQHEQRIKNETGRQRQQYSQRKQTQNAQSQSAQSQNAESYQNAEREEQPQARHTQTATGETIIDNRHQERENKKIFDDSDGEYVEFEEA